MDIMNYMNWEQVLINEIAGTSTVFIILALVVLLYICAKLRFPNPITLIIMATFILLMTPIMSTLLALLLVVVGLSFSLMINHLMGNR